MNTIPKIKLYGADGCHKTHYYQLVLDKTGLPWEFLDVEANEDHAEELRGLYENRKLNFPTITIGKKKLRNPYKEDIEKWLNKLIPSRLDIVHDKENMRFTLDINGEIAIDFLNSKSSENIVIKNNGTKFILWGIKNKKISKSVRGKIRHLQPNNLYSIYPQS